MAEGLPPRQPLQRTPPGAERPLAFNVRQSRGAERLGGILGGRLTK
jgi:hypothetical protein